MASLQRWCGLFGDVVEYVLHVLVLLEFFKELVEGFALLVGNLFHIVGDAHKFGGEDFKSVAFEVLLYVGIFLEGP